MERVFEDLSFDAPDQAGADITINAAYVNDRIAELAKSADMSRYIL